MAARKLAFGVLLCIILPVAAGFSLSELAARYDYSFSNGSISLSGLSDRMEDSDLDGVDDTFLLEGVLEGDAGTYSIIGQVIHDGGIASSSKTVTISPPKNLSLTFSSALLSGESFEYLVRVRDVSGELVYRSHPKASAVYSQYEQGLRVDVASDSRNASGLVISLSLDGTEAGKENVSAVLGYGNESVGATTEAMFSLEESTADVVFSPARIARTHHRGMFTLERVVVGEVSRAIDHSLGPYNYLDFAEEAAITGVTSGLGDGELRVNLSFLARDAHRFTVSFGVFSEDNDIILRVNRSVQLSLGKQTSSVCLDGGMLRRSGHEGPYHLKNIVLTRDGKVIDVYPEDHVTDALIVNSLGLERAPDLVPSVSKRFDSDSGQTTLQVNVTNLGEEDAFDALVRVFSNDSFSNETRLFRLGAGERWSTRYIIMPSDNATRYTAIVDEENSVTESDEQNNVRSDDYIAHDLDNDGVDDREDRVIGDKDSLDTTLRNVSIRIGNSTDLSRSLDGEQKVDFSEGAVPVVSFRYNMSRGLNLTSVRIEKQSNESFGYVVVSGLDLGNGTKSVMIERVDSEADSVCVKDAEVGSVSAITDDCEGDDEWTVVCDGSSVDGYACSWNASVQRYEVSGLSNTAVRQSSSGPEGPDEDETTDDSLGNSGGAGGTGFAERVDEEEDASDVQEEFFAEDEDVENPRAIEEGDEAPFLSVAMRLPPSPEELAQQITASFVEDTPEQRRVGIVAGVIAALAVIFIFLAFYTDVPEKTFKRRR